jgi:hypothetical protein
MATNKPQDSVAIPYHKRIAMGEKLDGSSMQPKGQQNSQPAKGGLAQAKNK